MPRLSQPINGKPIKNSATGFPAFMGKQHARVVTADVWAFLRDAISNDLKSPHRKQALAFLEQASEFYEAARSPRLSCRPLLHYYSFLNLAKVFLLLKKRKIAMEPKHGISKTKGNNRLRLESQSIHFPKCTHDHSELFPEFVAALGGNVTKPTTLKVISLLRQVPGIHRIFCLITKESPSFLPVKRFDLIKVNNGVCARLILNKTDRDVQQSLKKIRARRKFKSVFHQVNADKANNDEIWFETKPVHGARRGIHTAIKKLADSVCEIGVW